MIKRLKIGLLILGSLYSCNLGPRNLDEFMVDLDEFSINDTILKDGDYVEILGSSGNLTSAHEIDFYSLVVVRAERTRDTINVLVTNFYQSDLTNPRTRFISNNSLIGKAFEKADNPKELEAVHVNDLRAKSFKKVFYDTEFIQVDVRKYPAITGNLSDYTITGDVEGIGF